MAFQHPQAFFLLLLIPLLIALYFLKVKREDHYTPTFFLWAYIAKQNKPKSVWQKIFRNLILLFQILILVALVLALAKPRFTGEIDSEQPVVLIIDNSASMGAREGGRTRLEVAKELAVKLLHKWGNRQVMLAGAVGGKQQHSLTDDRLQLAAYIKSLPATDGKDDFPRLIPQLMARCPKPPLIYLISDGASPEMDRLLITYKDLNFVSVGRKSDNLAIVGVETRRNPISRERYQVLIRVGNYGLHTRRIKLETSLENELLDARDIGLAPGEQATVIVDGKGEAGGIIRSRLLIEDALSIDNQAYAILQPQRDITMLAVNVNHHHLQRALGILDRVRIIPMSKQDYQQAIENQPYTRFDIGVYYGFRPQKLLSWHNLLINPEGTSPVKIVSPLSWSRDHPIMSYLEFSHMRLKRTNSLKLYPQSQVLLRAGRVPLLVYDSRDRYSLLRLGFALEDSDFHLRPAFPMFLVNVLNFFATRPIPREIVRLEVEKLYLIPLPPEYLIEDKTGHIVTPQGVKIPITLHKAEHNYYRPLRAGRYQFVLEGFRSSFMVTLAESESRIAPYAVSSSHIVGKNLGGLLGGYAQGWHIFALLALGLVVLEWWYQREKMDGLY